ncbi:MAG: Protein translocase membrane subunit SecG, partial [uncultured Rubrobacteraceae bacterium]
DLRSRVSTYDLQRGARGAHTAPLRQGRRPLLLARRRNGEHLLRHDYHGEEPHPANPHRARALHRLYGNPDLLRL